MKTQYTSQIRLGLLTLPLWGLSAVVGILLRGPVVDASVNPQGFAQAATAPNYGIAWLIILVGQVIALFGYMALAAVLAPTRSARAAWWGMVLTVAGSALFVSLIGFMAFAAPVIGKLYLQGETDVMQVGIAGFFGGQVLSVLYPSGLLGAVGSLLFGVAIWRSGTLPKWAAVPFALAIILLAFAPAFSYVVELVGAVCALVSGAWIAAKVWM